MSAPELFNIGFNLFIVLLIWAWYRKRRCTPAEKYFTFWARLWTSIVDGCVLAPFGLMLGWYLRQHPLPVLGVCLSAVSNALGLIYTVWLHARYGQTVGKMVCKVRVVDHLTEGSISLQQAILRECVPAFANLGVMAYFLYLIGTGALTGEA